MIYGQTSASAVRYSELLGSMSEDARSDPAVLAICRSWVGETGGQTETGQGQGQGQTTSGQGQTTGRQTSVG